MQLRRTIRSVSCIMNGIFVSNLKQKRGGERYRVSPWKLIWKNENYYLLGMDEKSEDRQTLSC